jgi:acyl-CoA thioesterase II
MNPILPENPVAHLLEVLELEQLDENRFVGRTQFMPHGRVFGGQVLAQALVAANKTVEGRTAHSMHGYFLRAGDIAEPIEFEVDRLRDGRSFSSRRVQALQQGQPIFSMITSYQEGQPGLEHAVEMPKGLTPPDSLPSAGELLAGIDHPTAKYWANSRPFDLRHVQPAIYLQPAQSRENQQSVWFKALEPMPDDPALHQVALAYASDYTILESIYRRHGLSWAHPGISTASLDHAIWFHRPARVDQWLLYQQTSPAAQGGRGLSQGHIFTQAGELVATVAQEGMVRVPELKQN